MLENLLKNYFGCENPFLEEPKLIYKENDGTKHYEYLTKDGINAYNKLISALYELDNMGIIDDVDNIIESLDDIVNNNF